MQRPVSYLAWAALVFLGVAVIARADTLTLADGRELAATVTGIATGSITTAQAGALPVEQVRSLRFARPDVIPYPSGVWLTDGTLLCGVLRDLKTNAVTVRSVTLGEIGIPLERVAVIYFETPPIPSTLAVPASGLVRAVFKNGGFKEGRLLAVSAGHVLLRVDSGLEKLPIDNLACLVRAMPAATAEVTLRNGDRLAHVTWDGNRGTADAGAGPVTLKFEQVREIVFGKTGQ